METLVINKDNALKAYNGANDKGKKLLSDLLGDKVFIQNPIERFKTYEDICEAAGIYPGHSLPYANPKTKKEISINGFAKLQTIFEAFNDGWEPDYSDSSQYKYYPWFQWVPSRSVFDYSVTFCTHTVTYLGSRLCTNTSEKAKYIGEQFTAIYNEAFNPTI
jgi:hypothetical protein